jgi:hypothetical protein
VQHEIHRKKKKEREKKDNTIPSREREKAAEEDN